MPTTKGFHANSKSGGGNQKVSQIPVLIPDDTDSCQLLSADVLLCGRERASLTHPGNKRFRQLIVMKSEAYQKARSHTERLSIIEDLFKMVRNSGGRFLRRNTKSGQLKEMEDGLARELVQKAFQYVLKPIPKVPKRTPAAIIRKVSEENPSDNESRFQSILSVQRKIFEALMSKQGMKVP